MSSGVGDLRQSHFIMGQRKPNYGSEYRLEYTQKPNDQGDIKGDKNNLRASHFEYGTYQSKNFYTSTNQRVFRGNAPDERAQLNADKLHDLRSHHFSLGNQRAGYTSTTNSQFYPKESEESARHDQVEHRNKMRRHNFDLGDSNKNYFSSVYNQQFNKTYTPDQVAQGNVKHDLKEHALNLRKTNLVLGSDPRDHFNSITRQDYGKKEGHIDGQKQSNVELRRTHYSLGVADPEFKTINQDYFVAHPPQEVQYSKELANDLKTTHFSLGQDPPQFQSLANASYTNKANEGGLYGSVKDQNDQNRKNLVLGDKNHKTNYRSVYGSTMVPHKNVEPSQAITQDRTTSFKIGQAKSNYASESRSHYVHYDNPEKAGLHEGLMKDLQSSHFRFNEVKSNQFRTVGQTSYTNKLEESKGVNSKNHKDLQSDLTRTHFTIGNSRDAAPTTVARSTYTNPHGDPAKLDDARAKDLRTHHHHFGDGRLADKTTYNEEFFWKVNQNGK